VRLQGLAAESADPRRVGLALRLEAGGEDDRVHRVGAAGGGDDGAGAPALELWKDLVDEGSASRSVVNWNQQDVNDQFLSGRAAMMVNGPWQVPVLSAQDDVDWAVASIPVPQAGDDPVPPIGGTVMTIPKNEDHPERESNAAKILNCLNSEENQLAWGERVNNVPTRADAAQAYREENPELAAFADLVLTARSRTGEVGTGWPKVETALAGAFQSVLTGRSDPEAALERAQQQATAGE